MPTRHVIGSSADQKQLYSDTITLLPLDTNNTFDAVNPNLAIYSSLISALAPRVYLIPLNSVGPQIMSVNYDQVEKRTVTQQKQKIIAMVQ